MVEAREDGNKKKKWVEILLTPIVVAVIGGLALFFLGWHEGQNATRIAEIQRVTSLAIAQAQAATSRSIAEAERENERALQRIKIMEVFLEKMTSEDVETRKTGLKLSRLLDSELADRVLTVMAIEDPQETDEVRDLAQTEIEKRLRLSATASRYAISPGESTTITARVVDGRFRPVKDSFVQLTAFSGTANGLTNYDGEFVIEWRAPGLMEDQPAWAQDHIGLFARYYATGEHVLHLEASKEGYVGSAIDIRVLVHPDTER